MTYISDIASDRLARTRKQVDIMDIAHPADSAALRKILDAIAVVTAAVAAFKPAGANLDDTVGEAMDLLAEAAGVLISAGERDLAALAECV